VIISGTKQDILNSLVEELKERVHAIPANLEKPEEVSNLYRKAEEISGGIDILICNAGMTKDTLILRMTEEDWDKVINVNLKSAFILNREALKSMIKRKSGTIINITSISGFTGNFGQANYVASKAGLVGLTKTIALEGASRGITANCIAPGFIVTSMTDGLNDDIKQKIKSRIPLDRFGEPEDIANAALFLASNEAKFITGHTLHVNGGMYMG
jgi:3-oxoacyl-[acyl-carrier protein] reductase